MTGAILSLLSGLAMFLFGMSVMGDGLEKAAGNKLKTILSKMTSNPLSGFLLGLAVTAVIQSSSATTVMLVGFVNAGLITLRGAIPVIMGSNIGTTVTAWVLSLEGISGDWLSIFKPSSFTPFLAVIGVILYVFMKKEKAKDIGVIFLGFSVLIFGMDMMSSGFKNPEVEGFLGTFFERFATNPILGLLTGTVVTAIIQSSSASVGILQTVALASPGAFTLGMALPIIMGQNIGTCVTAVLGSAGANKDAKRVAAVHLSFNIIGSTVLLSLFCLLNYVIIPGGLGFSALDATPFTISVVHTMFNILCTAMLLPCYKLLEKLAILIVKDDKSKTKERQIFDDRLLQTPAIAIEQARLVTNKMAEKAHAALNDALSLLSDFDKRKFDEVVSEESSIDVYEDEIGTYLMKITSCDLNERESLDVSKLLHTINDLERLSDHAVNIAESAKEMKDKSVVFSESARAELDVMINAVREILDTTIKSFEENDLELAVKVEPLEEVIDLLQSEIKASHINRLKNNECTIELGFILTDILTNLERVSDHCSNIAGCVIEITHHSLGMHEYTRNVRVHNKLYDDTFKDYSDKYRII